MLKFAANLSMLFTEVDFLKRFELAKNSGFHGVEYLFPYDYDKQEIKDLLEKHQLTQVLHNLPAGNWAAGERGIACLPDRIAEFREGVDKAIKYANFLGCKQLNVLAGITPKGITKDVIEKTFIDNISYAADALKPHGIILLIEAINTFDIADFYVSSTNQTIDLINKSKRDNIFIQYDIYHMQRMEGEICNTLEQQLPKIKHIQLADNPGRFEPGTGEINYPFIFNHLNKLNYQGWIGCEYKPKTTTIEGLGWMPK